MNRCFSCGQVIDGGDIHVACAKTLFGVEYLPGIDFSLFEAPSLAQEMSGKLSISGVQPKLSMRLNRALQRLEVAPAGGEFILKPQANTYPDLPQNENLCMAVAAALGIETPPQSLVKLKDASFAYIIKRFDRRGQEKIHQESFFQILDKTDKYNGSAEEIGKAIKSVSDVPGLDVQLFWERLLFFFLIGNGDAHLKNFSLLYYPDKGARLSPAYDIVSSKMVISAEEDSAITINGKKNGLTGKDFLALAQYLNIPQKAIADRFADKQPVIQEMVSSSFLGLEAKNRLKAIVAERYQRLYPMKE